jgi:hypothetical protein
MEIPERVHVHIGFRLCSLASKRHRVPHCADQQAGSYVGLPVGALEPFKKKELSHSEICRGKAER